MNTSEPSPYHQYFSKYRLYLLALNSKRTEKQRILADIKSGYAARDLIDDEWQDALSLEIGELKRRLENIEFTVDKIPDTPQLIPCKLFLRLHFIVGLNLTETAEKLNISLSTLRRIRERCELYFKEFPPPE